jgi:hypothetical protein
MKLTIQVLAGIVLGAASITAQTPGGAVIARYTATTENISGAHQAIRIDVLGWSTAEVRDQLLAAWNLTKPAAGGGRGRGAANTDPFGSFGRNRPAVPDDDPAIDNSGTPAPAAPAAGGRGGRGGRGGGAPPGGAKPTPEKSLAMALAGAPVVGHLWSSEVAGYSLHSAVRLPEPDGGERIILISDRRLGAWNDLWKPVMGDASNYEFSVIELHVNAKGEGEGKVSLTGKVAAINASDTVKTIGLENYSGLPVVLGNVKRQSPESARTK